MTKGLVEQLPARAEDVRHIRRAVAGYARDAGADAGALVDIELAVAEACNNAVLHAGEQERPSDVWADVDEGELVVSVRDFGGGMDVGGVRGGMGLGLALIATLAESFEVQPAHPGTEVRMRFLLRPANAAVVPA